MRPAAYVKTFLSEEPIAFMGAKPIRAAKPHMWLAALDALPEESRPNEFMLEAQERVTASSKDVWLNHREY